jgi:TetR/AcrR family transcriptional regulator, cholesterol catabolism regulator
MSSDVALPSARRWLTGKRADTVMKLTTAALDLLREVGYHQVSLQSVAAKAGVARATAYMYFSSREHLVTEIFWRRMSSAQPPDLSSPDVTDRMVAMLRFLAMMVADEPALARALTMAMTSDDADVEVLRTAIGERVSQLIADAAGGDLDTETIQILELVHNGTMLRAGIGAMSYHEAADLAEVAARRLIGDR